MAKKQRWGILSPNNCASATSERYLSSFQAEQSLLIAKDSDFQRIVLAALRTNNAGLEIPPSRT